MWTEENRKRYERTGLRYPSDVTDEEWALIEPHLPPARKPRNNRPPIERRDVLDVMLYVLTTGCQWSQLPTHFPAKSTVHDYFVAWHCGGILARVHQALYCDVREHEGRAPTASLAIVDSQSVKGAEKRGVSIDASGYDAGKKIKGAKRHIAVDTVGLLIGLMVTPASVQDRDAIAPLLAVSARMFPTLGRAIADGGYQGMATADAVRAAAGMPLDIVKRSDVGKGFVLLPKRWIPACAGISRTFGWLGRCRRLAKDFERRWRTHAGWIILAMIRLMLRWIAKLRNAS